MSKTKTQVATKVLEKLGVLESGATADSADLTIIEDKYDSWYGVLAAEDKVSWGSGDNIPNEAVASVVSIIANDCLTEFIIPQDKQVIIDRDATKGNDNLKKLEYVDYVPEEIDNHYY
ncbi:MAG: hypothetical protein ABFS03_00930 [Chloroflexota bacterium]